MNNLLSTQQLLAEENISIESFKKEDTNYLHFIFKNKFDVNSSYKATKIWAEICVNKPNEKFVHIWDCQNMNGFDNSAKSQWMEFLNKYEKQTEKIQLVSENIMIRGAARIMSKFSKHELQVYKSMEELALNE